MGARDDDGEKGKWQPIEGTRKKGATKAGWVGSLLPQTAQEKKGVSAGGNAGTDNMMLDLGICHLGYWRGGV